MAALRNITSPCLTTTYTHLSPLVSLLKSHEIPDHPMKSLVITVKARKSANTRTESAKVLERKIMKKLTVRGTVKKSRLLVNCSDKQLYAMLVDDQNKKCLFYASTIQRGIQSDPSISAEVNDQFNRINLLSQYLKFACSCSVDLKIHEISSYDLNGYVVQGLQGQQIRAFEATIRSYGFFS